MEAILSMAIALFGGLLISRLTKFLKLPNVTAYLIAGILVGPYFLGRLGIGGLGFTSTESLETLSLISNVALGFIAYAIGNEFRLSHLKNTGKQATVIAIIQAVAATVFVDAALIGLHFILGEDKLPISVAITLGAIATATAPAATLMVVRQYKAKGPLTDTLLPVVALDDAVGLVVFAISFGIAKALEHGHPDIVSIIVNPLAEIICSLVLGAVLGVLLSWLERFFHSRSKRLTLSIAFVILASALSMLKFAVPGTSVEIGFSSLLVCMMMGSVFCNMCDFSAEIMDRTDNWTSPLFVLFFVISGAELEFDVFTDISVIIVGLVYIIARSAGKIIGASASSKLVKASPSVSKYLGITLLPQAGVALGMSVTVAAEFGVSGRIIRNIVLFAVLIYELFGPVLTKHALMKAGEIDPGEKQTARTEEAKEKKKHLIGHSK